MLNAALAGFGLAYLPEDSVQTHLADGRLIRVLADWCPPFSGLPSLLPEPPTTHAGICLAGRCATLPGLRVSAGRSHRISKRDYGLGPLGGWGLVDPSLIVPMLRIASAASTRSARR